MRFLLLMILAATLSLGGCATGSHSSYQADLVPGLDPEIPSDWSTFDIEPGLLTAKRWSEPINDMADFW
ncbi:MAG: hypothetical protein P9L94_18770 [Candidatus Hinthialibacter antarcticus]|nr:hypothetical protein [Candidatus Hinthialibacter antarcticus]